MQIHCLPKRIVALRTMSSVHSTWHGQGTYRIESPPVCIEFVGEDELELRAVFERLFSACREWGVDVDEREGAYYLWDLARSVCTAEIVATQCPDL